MQLVISKHLPAKFFLSGLNILFSAPYVTCIKTKLNSVALVRTLSIPTERPPPVGEVSANFCG